jgi:hypothetical protein
LSRCPDAEPAPRFDVQISAPALRENVAVHPTTGYYEGDTPVGEDYTENTQFSVDQNVEALFEAWGAYLRQALDKAKAE